MKRFFIVLSSAVLFASAHDSAVAFITALIFGVFLMEIYYVTESFLTVFFFHALYNFVQGIYEVVTLPFSYGWIKGLVLLKMQELGLMITVGGLMVILLGASVGLLRKGIVIVNEKDVITETAGVQESKKKCSVWMIFLCFFMLVRYYIYA